MGIVESLLSQKTPTDFRSYKNLNLLNLKQKNRTISKKLTEAAFIHPL
jgi:hypothetical protein